MKTLKQTDILEQKIAVLNAKHANEFQELKAQYFVVQKSVTVFSLVEQCVSEFYKTTTNNNNLFTNITSIVGGYLSNKMVVGDSKNTFKKIIGYCVQFAITKLLSKITNK
jgi:hypothetical protein